MSETPSEHIAVQLAGCELWLLADKAIWWPAQQALLVADLHLGKAASFRRLGQPVPSGTTAADLARLDVLLARFGCRRLIFLGDFLHAPESRTPALLRMLGEWRERHAQVAMTLIRGNHDRRAGDPPTQWAIETVAEPLLLGGLALQHEPQAHAERPVLAGHLHPAYLLRGAGRQRLRLPCFVLDERVSLLPSFGGFTGAMSWQRRAGQRIFVVGGGGIWPMP